MDRDTQLLLSVGHHLRQLLLKRALPSATIDKACSGYLEYLYHMRNSTASVNHLVLHFTTFSIKGRNKLGDIISSNAVAANIGCELIDYVDRRRKTGSLANHGAPSVSKNATVDTSRDLVKTNLPDTASMEVDNGVKPAASPTEKKSKSRWKRFKEKMARTAATKAPMQTNPAMHLASCENGASVAASSAPAALGSTPRIPDGHVKEILSPLPPEEKMLEQRVTVAGYDAYHRLNSGTSSNLVQDHEAVARATRLPLRIPLSREMEATVGGKPLQPSYTTRGKPKKQKRQPMSPLKQCQANRQRERHLAASRKRVAAALKNPSAISKLSKKEKRSYLEQLGQQIKR